MATDQAYLWAGIRAANAWWVDGRVPKSLVPPFRREKFTNICNAFSSAEAGRGVVVLGPRRVGKSTIAFQVVEHLLSSGVAPKAICFLAFDDPALKFEELGRLLDVYESRIESTSAEARYLVLDEIQYADNWPLWLKRIADRKLPYRFLATGSAATALRKGGADAGLGRWREIVLFPFSFREFIRLQGGSFEHHDSIESSFPSPAEGDTLDTRLGFLESALKRFGPPPPDETSRLQNALEEYLLRGGFPELAREDLAEARRRLRQDILERALGRDLMEVVPVGDPRSLERMFLRICRAPGALWNESDASKDLGIARPTVAKYLKHLEDSYLVFHLDNLARPERGQPKVYLVDPALRQALLGIDRNALVQPELYGLALENAVASALVASRTPGATVGFWRDGKWECDAVLLSPGRPPWLYEVKRSATLRRDLEGMRRCGQRLGGPFIGFLLHGHSTGGARKLGEGRVIELNPATWLYIFHAPE